MAIESSGLIILKVLYDHTFIDATIVALQRWVATFVFLKSGKIGILFGWGLQVVYIVTLFCGLSTVDPADSLQMSLLR